MLRTLIGLGCSCVVLAGCRPAADPSAASGPAGGPVEAVSERGPIRMVVRAEPSRVRVGDRLQYVLTVTAPQGVELRLPDRPTTLGEFFVARCQDAAAIPQGAQRVWRRECELEVFRSGTFEIPAPVVTYVDARAAASGPAAAAERGGELAGRALSVEVASVLQAGEDPSRFRDIKGPVAVRLGLGAWKWWIAAAVTMAAVAWLWWRRRAARAVPARMVPPHEWALAELRRLAAERYVEQGRVQEYYFGLSGIVREYIERRFSVHAPERTTPEFLAEARDHPALCDGHGRLLESFLVACDMVKFALYQPTSNEARAALDTAREFIEKTALVPAPQTTGEGGA